MNLAHNEFLRKEIKKRVEKVFGKPASLIKDANERGMNIDAARISKYFRNKSGGLTEEQILWVATRLGIEIHINFGKPIVKENKVVFELKPYDELESIRRLNKIFPKG